MHKELLRRVNRWLDRKSWSRYRFGLAVAKNSTLVQRIQEGNVTMRTIRKVERYLERNP